METGPTSQSITIKLAVMMAFIFIDLILNSFIESSFSLSFQSFHKHNYFFIVHQTLFSLFRWSLQDLSSSLCWFSFGKLSHWDMVSSRPWSVSSSGPSLSFLSSYVQLWWHSDNCFGERNASWWSCEASFWIQWFGDMEQFFLLFSLLSEVRFW